MSWGGSGSNGYDQSTTGATGEERRSDILKLILYDLNSAIAPHDHRITALQTAISEFDHDQDYKHDEELDLHADKILFQKLAFAFQVDRSSEEIAMICTALEMIYRASRPRVALSFAELRESVLPIFVEMLGKPLHLRKQEALDDALKTQAEKQGAQSVVYHDGGDAGSHRSGRSGTHDSAPSYNTDMSFRSAARGDMSYQSDISVNKPYKPQPDEASYMSYDEESLKKPSKHLDDGQSYRGYDDVSMDDRSYNQSVHAPASSVNESYRGEVFQDIDQEEQARYQTHQKFHHDADDVDSQRDDRTHQPSELPEDHIYQDEQQYDRTYDPNFQRNDQSFDGKDLLPDNETFQVDLPDDRTLDSYEHGIPPRDGIDETDEHFEQRDDPTYTTEDRAQQPNESTLSKYTSEVDDRSIQNCDPTPVEDCFQTDEDGTYTVKRSDAEETYHDVQSQTVHTSDKGAHDEVAISWPTKAYDNRRDGDGIATHVHATDQDDAEEATFEVTDKQGGKDLPTDDAALYASHALNSDGQSVAMESKSADDGYNSEEQPRMSTRYTGDQDTIGDEKCQSDAPLQPTSRLRVFDENRAPISDHSSLDASQAEGNGQFYSQDQEYASGKETLNGFSNTDPISDYSSLDASQAKGNGQFYSQDQEYASGKEAFNGFRNTDETSLYSGGFPARQSGEESFEVETVYSEDDDQSRDPSLVSKTSFAKTSGFSVGMEKPLKSAVASVGGLSTVAENLYESSPSFSSQSSMHKPKTLSTTGYSRPFLRTDDDDNTIHSSRTSTTASARAIKHKKMESERQMSEQIATLEAEVEFIRVEDTSNPVGVSRTLQVLRYFSRVLSAMVPMAHHPGLLDALVYQLERQAYGRHANQFDYYDDGEPRAETDKEELASARVDAIATIVNLACAEDNKAKMASHPGLLDAITTVAQCDPSEEAREHAAIVLMNLAYEDENKELMVQHEHMLDTLVKLIQDYSPFTRRYASAALFTLACVVGNTEKMAVFCDGEILECLRRVLADDPVDEARINAAEALFNMARNNTEETLQIMGDHPRLLATLAKAVLTDYSADARIFCARALEWMAVGIHFPMECHRLLLSALTVSAQWTKTSCIAEAMKTQATLAENRLPMAAHDGLLQAVATLALLESLTDSEVRKSAIATLEMMSRADKARPYMVKNEQVMRALTKASFERHDEEEDADDDQGTAVTPQLLKQALRNLASEM